MTRERSCETCLWFRTKPNAYDKRGQCHLNPPQLPPMHPTSAAEAAQNYWRDYSGIWPTVEKTDFCGEHAQRVARSTPAVDTKESTQP